MLEQEIKITFLFLYIYEDIVKLFIKLFQSIWIKKEELLVIFNIEFKEYNPEDGDVLNDLSDIFNISGGSLLTKILKDLILKERY